MMNEIIEWLESEAGTAWARSRFRRAVSFQTGIFAEIKPEDDTGQPHRMYQSKTSCKLGPDGPWVTILPSVREPWIYSTP